MSQNEPYLQQIRNTANVTLDVILAGMAAVTSNAYAEANAAYLLAQSGGTNANTGVALALSTGQAAYNQANLAYAQANTAEIDAQSGISLAKVAYGQANNAYSAANTAETDAQSGIALAKVAYSQANTAYGAANTAESDAQSGIALAKVAYGQANNAYGAANTASSTISVVYNTANLAYAAANAAGSILFSNGATVGGVVAGGDVTVPSISWNQQGRIVAASQSTVTNFTNTVKGLVPAPQLGFTGASLAGYFLNASGAWSAPGQGIAFYNSTVSPIVTAGLAGQYQNGYMAFAAGPVAQLAIGWGLINASPGYNGPYSFSTYWGISFSTVFAFTLSPVYASNPAPTFGGQVMSTGSTFYVVSSSAASYAFIAIGKL